MHYLHIQCASKDRILWMSHHFIVGASRQGNRARPQGGKSQCYPSIVLIGRDRRERVTKMQSQRIGGAKLYMLVRRNPVSVAIKPAFIKASRCLMEKSVVTIELECKQ